MSHSGLSTVGRRSRAGLDSQGQVASISNRVDAVITAYQAGLVRRA